MNEFENQMQMTKIENKKRSSSLKNSVEKSKQKEIKVPPIHRKTFDAGTSNKQKIISKEPEPETETVSVSRGVQRIPY